MQPIKNTVLILLVIAAHLLVFTLIGEGLIFTGKFIGWNPDSLSLARYIGISPPAWSRAGDIGLGTVLCILCSVFIVSIIYSIFPSKWRVLDKTKVKI